ncbi:YpmS family protein [Bacillus massiliigorillae]|uniref:YpmS family protein n=1 Tax=Bacillus massiliigorillae TaxID=1243664 RepID=UPI0003A48867|nr:YpmS family protein [Bacillus massiliigorillae]
MWKILFFLLIGINVAFVLVVLLLVGIPKEVKLPDEGKWSQEDSSILIQSKKESINQLIQNYIASQPKNKTIESQVVLDDYIEFYSKIPVFDMELQLAMTFTPVPLKNGDLLLKQRSMELGKMQLPVSYVLNFIKKENELPEWITIDPKKKQIYVALTDLEFDQGLMLKVNKFNLKEDDISFRLVVPSK